MTPEYVQYQPTLVPLAIQQLHQRRPGLIATLKGAHTEVVQWTEGKVFFNSTAWICLNILSENLKVAFRHPPARFFFDLSVLGVRQMFLLRRHWTRCFEDKRLRSITASPWSGCQATLVWQPPLPFSYKLSWFCPERFLYTNLWERDRNCRRRGTRPPWQGHLEPFIYVTIAAGTYSPRGSWENLRCAHNSLHW